MTFSVEFVIYERPVSWKRARQRGRQFFVDPETRAWKELVAKSFLEKVGPGFLPLETPIELVLAFRMPMPASWSMKRRAAMLGAFHTQKPDLDNLAKGIMDALNGLAWADDAQVFSLGVGKAWGPAGAVMVQIREVVR